MSEQPDERPVEAPVIHHEHVRTEGETAVDDAIGGTDDPDE